MTYSQVANVRLEAGDPDPEDVSDADILRKIEAADIIITNSTKHTWVDGVDDSFPLVEQISELLASSFIMNKFDDPKGEATKNYDEAMALLNLLVTEDEISSDINVATLEPKTFPLNPNGTIGSNRLRPNMNREVNVDPDDIYEQEF